MNTLFLDLASHGSTPLTAGDSLIACCDDTNTVSSQSVHARIGDHELIPMIEQVLKEAGWKFTDLHRIACVIGPGGFTSLRVAVTCVNVLADQLGIPSTGIHLSDVYRLRTDTDAYWFHSTKKDQLFVRGGQWEEPTLIGLDAIPHGNWMGELIPEHRARIDSDSIGLLSVTDVLPALLATQNYGKDLLTPWYGRGW